MQLDKGYSLTEALIALGILSLLVMFTMAFVAQFINATRQDFINHCLWEYTISTLERVKADPNMIGQSFTYGCGGIRIDSTSTIVSGTLPPNPPPPGSNQRACAVVQVTSQASGRIARINSPVCRF